MEVGKHSSTEESRALQEVRAQIGREHPCYLVVGIRRFKHESGEPSQITADDLRRSTWGLFKRYWHRRTFLDLLDFAMVCLGLFYGVGLIATRLWGRIARRSLRDGAALN